MSQATLPDTSTSAATLRAVTIHFPGGLLGFPEIHDYVLLDGPSEGLFWLVGDGEQAPRFLLNDPFVFFEGYSLELSPEQTGLIEVEESSTVAVLAITIPSSDAPWTANLQGPVVINVEKAIGAQIVLPGSQPGVRQPFQPKLTAA